MNDNGFTAEEMLDYAENMETTAFSKFVLKLSKYGSSCIYCFVEGYDLPYYKIRVEAISGKKCSFVDSGGKKAVVKTFDLIKSKPEYNKYKILYFVDRDYDNNNNILQNIFVTPCYSIENLYGTEDAFKNLIEGTYHIDEQNPKYQKNILLYHQEKDSFLNATKVFCAWYRCVKNKPNHDVELGESFPSKYATIGPNSITCHECNATILNNDYPQIDNISKDELDNSIAYINNDLANIRGKYVMQFMEYLIQLLNRDSNNSKVYTDTKVSFEQNRKTLITRLSAYADTPDILREYIVKYA